MTHEYKITGMTCGSCVARVKSELLKLGDILSADVQLQSPQATITMSKHVSTDTLQQAVNKAGNYIIAEDGNGVSTAMHSSATEVEEEKSYLPIFLIFGYIAGITLLIQYAQGSFNRMQWMSHFMAGFFLVFSFFKLMNLKGFAEGYQTYDIVAKKIQLWGFIYPFVELFLGISFLTGFNPIGTNIATLIVMGVSSIGVIQSLLKKTAFQCACLGTVIKLPLSKVTLFEDLLMVVMSAIMIISMT
ncbi:heavy-metal-associated domain-containing protein [Terrimonas pollutisoli]|uniref:heavy-metal-associated domain-containing protein n=1 Tax=Terrimonas pollutisoli TaxID=3034147 RepID=UPI0023EA8C5C|nr:MauE/DoxX family redox-associated membrane protein [Terrimonas sp. H1YJ31]